MAESETRKEGLRQQAKEILFQWWEAGGATQGLRFEDLLVRYPDVREELEYCYSQVFKALGAPGELSPGVVIDGEYRLEQALPRTGMGQVWKARQESLNRAVAVKFLLPEVLWDEGRKKRFRREAQTLAGLQHPNVVAIHRSGEWQGLPYIVMDWVDGLTLEQLLAGCQAKGEVPISESTLTQVLDEHAEGRGKGTRFESAATPPRVTRGYIDFVVRKVKEAALTLKKVHERGIVHRDIKPANILLDREGRIRIVDFGLAFRFSEDSHITKTRDRVGTPMYMSPEQVGVENEAALDQQTDVYSLGLVLYQMLTFKFPFESSSSDLLYKLIREKKPIKARKVCAWIPRDLEAVIEKATEKERAWRYKTAQEFGEDLERFLSIVPVKARGNVQDRAFKSCRRHPVGIGLVVGALIACAALGYASLGVYRSALYSQLLLRAQAHVADGQIQLAIPLCMRLDSEFGDPWARDQLPDLKLVSKLGGAAGYFVGKNAEAKIGGIRACLKNIKNNDPDTKKEYVVTVLLRFVGSPASAGDAARDRSGFARQVEPEVRAEAIKALRELKTGKAEILDFLARSWQPKAEEIGRIAEPIEYLSLLAGVRFLGWAASTGDTGAVEMLRRFDPFDSLGKVDNLEKYVNLARDPFLGMKAQPGRVLGASEVDRVFSCSAFVEEFDKGPALGAGWDVIPGNCSVVCESGVLRYKMGYHVTAFPDALSRSDYNQSTLVTRRIYGLNWRLTAEVSYQLIGYTYRGVELLLVLNNPALGTKSSPAAGFRRYGLDRNHELEAVYSVPPTSPSAVKIAEGLNHDWLLCIERHYNEIVLSARPAGEKGELRVCARTLLPDDDLEKAQWLLLYGDAFKDPLGSYVDFRWIKLEDLPETRLVQKENSLMPRITMEFADGLPYLAVADSLGGFRENWIAAAGESGDRVLLERVWTLWQKNQLSDREKTMVAKALRAARFEGVEAQLAKVLSANENETVMRVALRALADMGAEEEILKVLTERQGESSLKLQSEIIAGLASFADSTASGASLGMLQRLAKGESRELRYLAARALVGHSGINREFWAYADGLVRCLETLDDRNVWEPIARLASMESGKTLADELSTLLRCEQYGTVQDAALSAAEKLPTKILADRVKVLSVALESPREALRQRAVVALFRVSQEDDAALNPLVACMEDPSRVVSLEAACRLAELAARPRGLSAFGDRAPGVRDKALDLLSSRSTSTDWQELTGVLLGLKRLKADSRDLQERALWLLWKDSYDFKKNEDYTVSLHAAEYLAVIGGEDTLDPLRQVMRRMKELMTPHVGTREEFVKWGSEENIYISCAMAFNAILMRQGTRIQLGDVELLTWVFDRKVDVFPDDSITRRSLTWLHSAAGQNEEACAHILAALEIAPQSVAWIEKVPYIEDVRANPAFEKVRRRLAAIGASAAVK